MQLDLAPLTNDHILMFGIGFIVVYGVIAILLNQKNPMLRMIHATESLLASAQERSNVYSKGAVYFAGPVLLSAIALASFFLIPDKSLSVGLLGASILILIVGIYDEYHPIKAGTQLIWQALIVIFAISWGWSIKFVSNPFGEGVINLQDYTLGHLFLPGGLIAFIWLMVIINSLNWLDGTDGLAIGVSFVALITLCVVSLLPSVQDSATLMLALLGAGATLGFLLWNFPPAKIYLGTTGSWFLGLYIGLIAVMGGGKMVTTLLVLFIPVFDLIAVITQRILLGRPIWQGDTTNHLHYRLRNLGVKPFTIAISGILVTAILGVIAVSVQTQQKIATLFIAAILFTLLSMVLMFQKSSSRRNKIQ